MFSRAQYYFRRIWQSSPYFLLFKVKERLSKSAFMVAYFFQKVFGLPRASSEQRETCQIIMGDIGRDIRETLNNASKTAPDWLADSLVRAQMVKSGRFPCLGFGIASVDLSTNWQEDPFHGYVWPKGYFNRINFLTTPIRSDVKIPWELSRMQYMLWLAEGYVLDSDNDSVYQEKFEKIVHYWNKENPPGFGVNWIVSMEVAIRCTNLALAASVFWEGLRQEIQDEIIDLLASHRKFIKRFPEFSDVNGNHYLSNLMGLAVVDMFLFGVDSSVTQQSLADFYEEAGRQFELDGCHLERAPMYHRLCTDMLAIVYCLDRRNNSGVCIGSRILERAISFCKHISSSSETLPIFGDCDSGHVLWFGENARNCGDLFALVECLGEVGRSDRVLTSNLLWHLGILKMKQTPNERFEGREEQKQTIIPYAAKASGFIAARVDELDCTMRVGFQGLEGRAPHDHDDALSIWISYRGEDIVVDQGCHSYSLDQDIRRENISSLAHNVVQPLNKPRYSPREGSIFKTVQGAPFAQDSEFSARENSCVFSASLNADNSELFRDCKRKVELSAIPEPNVLVIDSWQWLSARKSEIRWHFPPNLDFQILEDQGIVEIFNGQQSQICKVLIQAANPICIEQFAYGFSEVYGSAKKAMGFRICLPCVTENTVETRFLFNPCKN